jgi:tetratricopeptide (TPR) repeat protein
LQACQYVTVALLVFSATAYPALAADTANESRAINQQVLNLMKASKLDEAEPLAKKGLQLCDDAGSVKVFCASQFNESLGDIAYTRQQYPTALAYQEQALKLRQAGLGDAHPLVSRSLQRMAQVYMALNRMTEAEDFVERAVAGFEKLPVNSELATALGYLGRVYLDTNRLDSAVMALRRKLTVFEAIGDRQGISSAKQDLSNVLSRKAKILVDDKNYREAGPTLVRAIELVDPPPSGAEKTFAVLQAQLGHVYEQQGRHADAEPFMLRALEYRLKAAGPSDSEIPTMLYSLASLYNNLHKPAEATSYGLRAISWFDENRQERPNLGFVLVQVGRAQRQLGKLQDAEVTLVRARDVLDRVLPKTDPMLASVRADIGMLRLDQEQYGEAEQTFKSALQSEQLSKSSNSELRSTILAYLGLIYRDQARYPDAERRLLESIKLEEAAGNERLAILAERLTILASILRRQNRYAEAEAKLLMSLSLEQPTLNRAIALNLLGVVYTNIDQYEKAQSVLQEALAIRTKGLPTNSYYIAETIGNLVSTFHKA